MLFSDLRPRYNLSNTSLTPAPLVAKIATRSRLGRFSLIAVKEAQIITENFPIRIWDWLEGCFLDTIGSLATVKVYEQSLGCFTTTTRLRYEKENQDGCFLRPLFRFSLKVRPYRKSLIQALRLHARSYNQTIAEVGWVVMVAIHGLCSSSFFLFL